MIDPQTVIEQRYLTALERSLEGELPEAWQKLPAPEGVQRGAAAVLLRLSGEPTVEAMLGVLDQATERAATTAAETRSEGETTEDERRSVRRQTQDLWSDLRNLLEPYRAPRAREGGAAAEPPELLAAPEAAELVTESLRSLQRLARATAGPRLGPELRREIVVRLLRARARVWADEARDEEQTRIRRIPQVHSTPREERP